MTPKATAFRLTRRASRNLDALRAVAAALVFVGHLRSFFFVDAKDASLGVALKLVYYASGFGHAAVVVFFVLSGFLVGGSVLRAHAAGEWSWSQYAKTRATRLYVVLLPALLLTAAFDNCGAALFGVSGTFYGGDAYGAALVAPPLNQTGTFSAFFGNLAFLQTMLVPCFGTNAPLWSLSMEAWFYLLFPLLMTACLRRYALWRRIVCATCLLAFAVAFPAYFNGFLLWLMGAAVAWSVMHLPQPVQRSGSVAILASLALATCLHLHRIGVRVPYFFDEDQPLGIATALFVWSLLLLPEDRAAGAAGTWYARVIHSAAEMSFTLYCVHFPLLAFAQAALLEHSRWTPDSYHLLIAAGLLLAGLLYAYLVSTVTEARTPVVRRYIDRVFS